MKNLTQEFPFEEFKNLEIKHVWNLAGGGDCPCIMCGVSKPPPPPPPPKK